MKCWKCKEEMHCIEDTGWKEYIDGERVRKASFMCPECRTWIEYTASDLSKCGLDE